MEKSNPLVSFFVLGYNQEDYIKSAIEGAFSQTYSPLEIVLSDDGSSDRTFEIMTEMASAYDGPHRIVLNKNSPNRGIVGNVNELMRLSTGEFVIKNDGDDVSTPDRAEKLVACWLASNRKSKLVFSATLSIDENGKVIEQQQSDKSIPEILREKPTALDIVSNDLHARGATTGWSRELYDIFGPILETAVVEDNVIPFRASLLGDISYVDEALVYHREGGYTWLDKKQDKIQEKMYGRRIMLYNTHIESKRAMMHDLKKIECENKQEILETCKEYIKKQSFRIELSKMSLTKLVILIPYSTVSSLYERCFHYLYLNIKYIAIRSKI